MTTHICFDLETWGTTPGSDIRSIGACVFAPETGLVHDGSLGTIRPFYIATDNPLFEMAPRKHSALGWLTPHPRRKYPLTRDPATEQWWAEQSDEAQAAFADAVDLKDGLERFATWLSQHDDIRLWAHGAAFDPPIAAAAYAAVGLPVPWHYRAPRDTRTIFEVAGMDPHRCLDMFTVGTQHHALDDAICEARAICAGYRALVPATCSQPPGVG